MGGRVGGDRTSVEPSRVRFSRTHRAASVSGREILIIRAGPEAGSPWRPEPLPLPPRACWRWNQHGWRETRGKVGSMSALTRRETRGLFPDLVDWLESPFSVLRPFMTSLLRMCVPS